MSKAASDYGTVLDSDQAAITWSPAEGFRLLFPNYADDSEVPEPVLALAALIVKLDDEIFLQELVDEFSSVERN